ncbi:hypothetical protein, partial [Paludibacterium sp.]
MADNLYSATGALGAMLLGAASIAASTYTAAQGGYTLTLVFDLLAMVLLFGALGLWITHHLLGMLIDSRNVYSLARLQTAGWSLLVFAAILAMAIINLSRRDPAAIDIQLPSTLLTLMGISATSLVGSSLILATKKNTSVPEATAQSALTAMAGQMHVDDGQLTNQGVLVANKQMGQARWRDLLTGEELADAGHIDIARVQMLFFSLASLIVYGVEIGLMIDSITPQIHGVIPQTHGFPPISANMITLIAISQGGYLINKAIPAT